MGLRGREPSGACLGGGAGLQDRKAHARELARYNPAYESVASKFLEHFVHIAHAMNDRGGEGVELWDKEDGFYYDVLHLPNGERHYLKVRSLVGLIPLLAVETLEQDIV